MKGNTNTTDLRVAEIESVSSYKFDKTQYSHLNYNSWVRRSGKVVSVYIYGLKNITNQTGVTLFTLPEEYRPTEEVYFPIRGVGVADEVYRISILANGEVKVYAYNGVTLAGNLNATLTYVM